MDRLAQSRQRGGRKSRDVDSSRSDDVDSPLGLQPVGLHGVQTAVGKHSFLRSEERKIAAEPAHAIEGRPTKRDRRALDRAKGEP